MPTPSSSVHHARPPAGPSPHTPRAMRGKEAAALVFTESFTPSRLSKGAPGGQAAGSTTAVLTKFVPLSLSAHRENVDTGGSNFITPLKAPTAENDKKTDNDRLLDAKPRTSQVKNTKAQMSKSTSRPDSSAHKCETSPATPSTRTPGRSQAYSKRLTQQHTLMEHYSRALNPAVVVASRVLKRRLRSSAEVIKGTYAHRAFYRPPQPPKATQVVLQNDLLGRYGGLAFDCPELLFIFVEKSDAVLPSSLQLYIGGCASQGLLQPPPPLEMEAASAAAAAAAISHQSEPTTLTMSKQRNALKEPTVAVRSTLVDGGANRRIWVPSYRKKALVSATARRIASILLPNLRPAGGNLFKLDKVNESSSSRSPSPTPSPYYSKNATPARMNTPETPARKGLSSGTPMSNQRDFKRLLKGIDAEQAASWLDGASAPPGSGGQSWISYSTPLADLDAPINRLVDFGSSQDARARSVAAAVAVARRRHERDLRLRTKIEERRLRRELRAMRIYINKRKADDQGPANHRKEASSSKIPDNQTLINNELDEIISEADTGSVDSETSQSSSGESDEYDDVGRSIVATWTSHHHGSPLLPPQHPIEDVCIQLSTTPGRYNGGALPELRVSGHPYLGHRGLLSLLPVIKANARGIRRLILSNCGLGLLQGQRRYMFSLLQACADAVATVEEKNRREKERTSRNAARDARRRSTSEAAARVEAVARRQKATALFLKRHSIKTDSHTLALPDVAKTPKGDATGTCASSPSVSFAEPNADIDASPLLLKSFSPLPITDIDQSLPCPREGQATKQSYFVKEGCTYPYHVEPIMSTYSNHADADLDSDFKVHALLPFKAEDIPSPPVRDLVVTLLQPGISFQHNISELVGGNRISSIPQIFTEANASTISYSTMSRPVASGDNYHPSVFESLEVLDLSCNHLTDSDIILLSLLLFPGERSERPLSHSDKAGTKDAIAFPLHRPGHRSPRLQSVLLAAVLTADVFEYHEDPARVRLTMQTLSRYMTSPTLKRYCMPRGSLSVSLRRNYYLKSSQVFSPTELQQANWHHQYVWPPRLRRLSLQLSGASTPTALALDAALQAQQHSANCCARAAAGQEAQEALRALRLRQKERELEAEEAEAHRRLAASYASGAPRTDVPLAGSVSHTINEVIFPSTELSKPHDFSDGYSSEEGGARKNSYRIEVPLLERTEGKENSALPFFEAGLSPVVESSRQAAVSFFEDKTINNDESNRESSNERYAGGNESKPGTPQRQPLSGLIFYNPDRRVFDSTVDPHEQSKPPAMLGADVITADHLFSTLDAKWHSTKNIATLASNRDKPLEFSPGTPSSTASIRPRISVADATTTAAKARALARTAGCVHNKNDKKANASKIQASSVACIPSPPQARRPQRVSQGVDLVHPLPDAAKGADSLSPFATATATQVHPNLTLSSDDRPITRAELFEAIRTFDAVCNPQTGQAELRTVQCRLPLTFALLRRRFLLQNFQQSVTLMMHLQAVFHRHSRQAILTALARYSEYSLVGGDAAAAAAMHVQSAKREGPEGADQDFKADTPNAPSLASLTVELSAGGASTAHLRLRPDQREELQRLFSRLDTQHLGVLPLSVLYEHSIAALAGRSRLDEGKGSVSETDADEEGNYWEKCLKDLEPDELARYCPDDADLECSTPALTPAAARAVTVCYMPDRTEGDRTNRERALDVMRRMGVSVLDREGFVRVMAPYILERRRRKR